MGKIAPASDNKEIPSSAWNPLRQPLFRSLWIAGQGPVMIMVEYRIDPADADAFVPALQALGHIRRRDGAVQWGMYRDTADAGRYVETFFLESWVEHLRQHERITVNDRIPEDRVLAFHKGRNRPAASHFTYADGKQTGKDAGRRSLDES